ncbi:MAG: hypothetical protein PHT21_12840, partial [Lachnospiraceae bacterium]|nr:hypothetical protein [Lachnospiraceae bacterium]
MKRLIRKGERSLAFLLAVLMAFSSPVSAFAEEGQESTDENVSLFSDGSSPDDELQYIFSEEVSEDGLSSNVKLEVTEGEGNTLNEVILPDGSSVYPEATVDKEGFKQNVDGVERNIVTYTADENGNIPFKLKYTSTVVQNPEELQSEEISEREVQAAGRDAHTVEKEIDIEYEVTDIQDRALLASRSTTVTSLDELNTAIANAGDGDT